MTAIREQFPLPDSLKTHSPFGNGINCDAFGTAALSNKTTTEPTSQASREHAASEEQKHALKQSHVHISKAS